MALLIHTGGLAVVIMSGCAAEATEVALETDTAQPLIENLAERCYQSGDLDCLERFYTLLALGARWKYPTASAALSQALVCQTSDLEIESARVASLPKVREATQRAVEDLQTQPCGTFAYPIRGEHTDRDIAYTFGNFFVTSFVAADGVVFEVRDRYDWISLDSEFEIHGVGRLRSEWAQALVDSGRACEFDVVARWQVPLPDSVDVTECDW